jgi:hypothetical protein
MCYPAWHDEATRDPHSLCSQAGNANHRPLARNWNRLHRELRNGGFAPGLHRSITCWRLRRPHPASAGRRETARSRAGAFSGPAEYCRRSLTAATAAPEPDLERRANTRHLLDRRSKSVRTGLSRPRKYPDIRWMPDLLGPGSGFSGDEAARSHIRKPAPSPAFDRQRLG